MLGYKLVSETLNNRGNKINAPEFAYRCLYNKPANPPIYGREASHPSRMYNGIPIDKNIPLAAIKNLNKIKDIELTSSCQGDSDRHLSFVIFRALNRDEKYSESIVKKLNKYKDVSCCYDIGQAELPRIVVTTRLLGDQDIKKFEKWWMNLSVIIKKSL
jgi:hypothetical protein